MASTLYPMSEQKKPDPAREQAVGVVCPYCGHAQSAAGVGAAQCAACKGLFDPLSRQATQNAMGPWWVLNPQRPTSPGISYEKLAEMVRRGKVTKSSIVRGPTTRQFWALARDTAGVAVLLGECHNCHRDVMPDEFICAHCNTVLAPRSDRQHLGLAPVQLLPGEASPTEIAASTRSANPAAPIPRHAPQPRVTPTPSGPADAPQGNEPEPVSSSARRMRQQMARQQIFLVVLLILVGVLVAAVAILILDPFEGVSFGKPKSQDTSAESQPSPFPQAPSNTDDSPSTEPSENADFPKAEPPITLPDINVPEMPPPIADDAPLDAALEPWRDRFNEALTLERADTIQSVTSAIAMLESILAEASAQDMSGLETYPLVEDRLAALRDRLEILRLREQFDQPGI